MVNKAFESKCLSGIKMSRECPVLSHLFFADDSLFFLPADKENGGKLKSIVVQYCECSGQAVNMNKSNIIISSNVLENVKQKVADVMQM